jgi:hypothetical protein
VGGAVHRLLEVGVGERLAVEEDGRLVRKMPRGSFQVLSDVHGILRRG